VVLAAVEVVLILVVVVVVVVVVIVNASPLCGWISHPLPPL
jgi:hypothetical protein